MITVGTLVRTRDGVEGMVTDTLRDGDGDYLLLVRTNTGPRVENDRTVTPLWALDVARTIANLC